MLSGHSLKEELPLWELFKNLKTARNSFVHEGIPKVGGTEISSATAAKLVAGAADIVKKIREWLPPEFHWPYFEHKIQARFMKALT